MRTITDHKVSGLNEALEIKVLDEPGHGGACHLYEIELLVEPHEWATPTHWMIHFQNGPVSECGFNGVSNESLLAIVIDRLRSFQNGEFNCMENAAALISLEEALWLLQKRTRDRIERGVEGTNIK